MCVHVNRVCVRVCVFVCACTTAWEHWVCGHPDLKEQQYFKNCAGKVTR